MSAATPTIIAGRYELQRRLAQGGMAEVWLALDLTLDRKVAVKWLKPTLATDEVVAERFRREAVAAASLNHPNIVAVHDVFEQDGRQAVVMQLVDGKSLRQLLDTQKRLSPELTCHIGTAVAGALDHAHHAGFVHRDVKPGNIMITPDGRVLLTDFGIAKGLHGDSGDDLTSDNIMMGTAKYLSPEQVRGKRLDGRADLYSLGLVLYECLAGRVPFLGETDADTALARLQRDPTDLARLRATLPTALVDVIHDLLARNPDRRPATGAELIVDLKRATKEGAPKIDPTGEERSPVAPFAAGRLVRAPSDLRGRADDRHRGMRSPTPPRGKTSRESPSRPTRRPRDRLPMLRREPPVEPDVTPPPIDPILRTTPTTGEANIDPILRTPPTTGDADIDPILRTTPTTGDAAIDPIPLTTPTTGDADIDPILRTTPTTGEANIDPILRPARIPGEPEHITGRVPAQPSTSAIRPAAGPPRDPTPPAGVILRGAPARGMGQRLTPSMTIVGGLLAVGVVLAIVLALTLGFGGGDVTPVTTVLPDGSAEESTRQVPEPEVDAVQPTAIDEPATSESVVSAAVQIVGLTTFDPEGDGTENDELASAALADGDPNTEWRTSCYSGEYMGGKRGVGLVVSYDGETARPLSVDVINGPYIVELFGTTDAEFPLDFAGWTEFARTDALDPATIVVEPDGEYRHVLLLLQQLGADAGCSDENPYRGGFAEIAFTG